MRHALLAALAATLCHASVAAAGERPSHDPAIEAAAIAILQKRLPEIRAAHGIAGKPVFVRAARPVPAARGISALIDLKTPYQFPGRIVWL